MLGSDRVADTDQFTMEISTGAGGTTDATTTGTGPTIVGGQAEVDVDAGTTVTVGERAAGTTDLGDYTATVTCTDEAGVATDLPDDEPLGDGAEVTLPGGALVTCTILNTADAPTLTTIEVRAVFATDRARDGDQVTVGIGRPEAVVPSDGPAVNLAPGPDGIVVSDPADATTAGAGSVVEPGTGTTGTYVAQPGTAYGIGERAAGATDLSAYTATLTCVDAAGLQSGLPTDAAHDGTTTITPDAGARITCTITNRAATAAVEDVEVTKELVSTTPTDSGHEVRYRLTVENVGTTTTTYDLDATLFYGEGVGVGSAAVVNTAPGDVPVVEGWDGRTQTQVVAGAPLGVAEVHVFTVTIEVVIDDDATAASLDCAIGPDETGSGITNSATLRGPASDDEARVVVCGEVTDRDPTTPTPTTPAPPAPGPVPLARTGAGLGVLTLVGVAVLALGALLASNRRGQAPRRGVGAPRPT